MIHPRGHAYSSLLTTSHFLENPRRYSFVLSGPNLNISNIHTKNIRRATTDTTMRITLNIFNPQAGEQDSLLTLEIFPDMTLATLRESIQAESTVPPTSQHIYHNGRLISDDTQTMEQLQIVDGEMLAVHVRDMRGSTGVPEQARRPQPRRPAQNEQDPELIRLQILGQPALRQQLQSQHPELAAAVDNPARFAQIFHDSQNREQRERQERQREIERLNDDPFNVENQRKIEEMIRQERVMENLQNAMEHNPEVFGRVHMLYVDVEVNGHPVKAFVDSGAQATIMSPSCAEACGIMRLIDTRFAGVAHGVGTARIIGRVHSAQIKIGNLFLPCSFTVMEGRSVDLLLGLDMLKRHQATIDLARDKLIIQGEMIPFLGEAEIPKAEEEAAAQEPTLPGPDGTAIGQRTGAVVPPGQHQQQIPARPQAAQSAPSPAAAAAPAPSAPQAPPAAQSAPTTTNISPQAIESLISMGATREQAIQALQAAEGDPDVAAGLIFF
ncbi:DNA damage-inducible protein 1 [Fusarium oxysporum]|uniref:DNA damage-inducible protein 1 n=1 Tax=Fusarium oxysporum TaxID=5507 RepID=A0A420NQN0_FUSOX|nr:DNA damage-inducible protein 1 [Fusarium oxysporum]RKL05164.1 DNA damage-inducible protein 1 [Fusarium oxysporum]RKL17405.1 DNA damage-inducible protein 1 [Fusarium oxysporum]